MYSLIDTKRLQIDGPDFDDLGGNLAVDREDNADWI